MLFGNLGLQLVAEAAIRRDHASSVSQVRRHAAAAAALEDFGVLKALHWDGERQRFLDWGNHSENITLQARRSALLAKTCKACFDNWRCAAWRLLHRHQADCSVLSARLCTPSDAGRAAAVA